MTGETEAEKTADATGGPNEALWLAAPRGPFEVRPAPMPTPGAAEVVVQVAAVAVNPVDAISGTLRRIVTPWVRYPTILGSDVAGEIVAIGEGVSSLKVGDRVVGYAAGAEKQRNSAAEGGFQHLTVVLERVTSVIPNELAYEQACVLPLALATAAAGLFEADQLALPYPTSTPTPQSEQMVLVWGASTSVGCNAVQLARAAGFTVVGTAGPANQDLVRDLGAAEVFDYRDGDIDNTIIEALRGVQLVGTIAIGQGSLTHALRIAGRTAGTKRIASAYPDPVTRARALLAKPRGIKVSAIWGGTPVQSEVGPAVFKDYLPAALAARQYRPSPAPVVVGHGLDAIPDALARMRRGVSAMKLVVTLDTTRRSAS